MSMNDIGVLSQDQIREVNRVNVLNYMKLKDNTTKQEIAKELGMSIPTVTSIINLLIDEAYVKEAGVARSTGGRKPVILEFIKDAKYSVGVNIMPDLVQILLVNLKMEKLDEINFKYQKNWDFTTALLEIEKYILELLSKHNMTNKKILGIGISMPGIVDENNLILQNAPNLCVKDYSLIEFQNKIGLPLYIENEANVAALAEVKLGSLKNARNIVYISITEGVGTGIVINRQIFKSTNKKAGEFGHMRVTKDDVKCKCGRNGCWEIYASKNALIDKVKQKTGLSVTDIKQVTEETEHQNAMDEALQDYIDDVLVGVENIILALNPEYIVLGGELGASESTFNKYIQSSKNSKCSILEYEGTHIVFSGLKDQGSKLGSALLPLETVFSHVKSTIS